ncbi:hypothetical protein [Dongia rigui]|uniref:PH domain-containing protein n=1 Tax=Dongia rigui TaxID=940149 RepID=A0ABU5E007_9PROT|nr:hypothetical protein [Dongia rigui]MDY0872788.1 hypothetical protein [Dongia rigui]
MTDTPPKVKLPIRLIPNRLSAIGGALVVPIIGVFVLWRFGSDMLDIWRGTDLLHAFTAKPLLTLSLGIGVGVMLWAETVTILRALPNGPFFYFELGQTGVTLRRLSKIRSVTWDKVGRIDLVERMQRSGKTKRMHWWVLIEPNGTDVATDLNQRIKQALLAYDTNDLAPVFSTSQVAANEVLMLLKRVQKDVQAGERELSAYIAPALHDVSVPIRRATTRAVSQNAVAKARRSGGVIER